MTEVYVLVEGETEKRFIEMVLCPYCSAKGVYLRATLLHKRGNKPRRGGDVKFERVHDDIASFLKQRPDTLVATFVDFYGIKEWPNLDQARRFCEPADIAGVLNSGAVAQMQTLHQDIDRIAERYIPFTAVHEFETLLLSEPKILAEQLGVEPGKVQKIVESAGGPEYVNNSPQTAPSKRLEEWSFKENGAHYMKTTQGVTIAKSIGIPAIRSACPLFDAWLRRLGV